MRKLKFCLLVECNEIQTIISGVESNKEHTNILEYGPNSSASGAGSTTLWSETQSFTSEREFDEEQDDMLEDDPNNSESEGWSNFAQQAALLNLQYLHIYYLKNLVNIWRTPTNDKQCLPCLKFLRLDMCPKLSVIFHPTLLANLGMLEVLIVKDCPEVTTVVSLMTNEFIDPQVLYLPSLKRISLLYLPKLASISSGVQIAPNLEKIGFYNCPKLESLSTGEMSSRGLEVIRGESKWWEALKWNESEWGNRLDYLQSIFCPITREKDVMTQMEEISRIPSRDQTRMVI
ncbi:hypothetical protein SLEP1_g58993 [Rubroshorea leprosula]|uniref:Disease resistance protein At4g27190-like leucine-rich repeats domain-containing protein n=1 Tax=Rubroshorea leprosula TaxID=152421 RepID=A0AAV5MTH8_9ROSI|nr:hypothetical protein SLEP1_g58993 [Rubroshorea leprosula]